MTTAEQDHIKKINQAQHELQTTTSFTRRRDLEKYIIRLKAELKEYRRYMYGLK